MSLLIVHFLLLALALGGSASDRLQLRERINVPDAKPISFSRTCDFFSSNFNDFKNGPCTEKDLDSKGNCNKTQQCKEDSHCYMSWFNVSGVVEIVKSGCWMKNPDCRETPECRAHNGTDSKGVYFCCCLGDNCNRNFYLDPALDFDETDGDNGGEPGPAIDESSGWLLVLYILLPLCMVCSMIIFAYWCYRKRKSVEDELDGVSVDTPATGATRCTTASSFPITNEIPTSPQFLDVKARGRFGKVWRAQLHDKIVAVKTFDLNERASWQNEQDIFCTPLMNTHDNILKFFMAHNRGSGLNSELWLITEFYDRGSLADFLKVNTVTFSEGLQIMKTMASGMSFLHEDVQDPNGYKPSIAHRDFKSKNVLLDQNLNAVIADFGLAVKFTPGESPGESHGQVGTLRYMAPEVLEGAINFQKDAFLRIDMYAFGLVIWEISTRCSFFGVPGDFEMPFEAELGTNPTMDRMQEFVVEKKLRPRIMDEWKTNKMFASLCETMEECWDHDAEARLSAGCVELRVSGMQRQRRAVEATHLIVNTSPTQNGLGDTEVMNQRNLQKQQMNVISHENNKNLTQQNNGPPQTTSFSEAQDNQGQYNKVQGDAYVVFPDDDHDSGTFANEDTLSHDGIMEQLIANEDLELVPDVTVAPGDVSSDTSLLTSSERESDL